MNIVGDQLALDLRQSHRRAEGSNLAMSQSLHGIVGMGEMSDTMLYRSLHLFVISSRVRGRNRDPAPHADHGDRTRQQ